MEIVNYVVLPLSENRGAILQALSVKTGAIDGQAKKHPDFVKEDISVIK